MAKDEAVRPGRSISQVMLELKREAREPLNLDPDDEALQELAQMPGWKILEKYILARVENLNRLSEGDISKDSLEAIGLKAIVADIVKDELKAIADRVNGAKEVVENERQKD